MWFPDDVQRLQALSALMGRLLIRSTTRSAPHRAPSTAETPPAAASNVVP